MTSAHLPSTSSRSPAGASLQNFSRDTVYFVDRMSPNSGVIRRGGIEEGGEQDAEAVMRTSQPRTRSTSCTSLEVSTPCSFCPFSSSTCTTDMLQ